MPDSIRPRMKTGIPKLDEALGGGLLPGALSIVAGATGIGKTQLGLHFLHAGQDSESSRGIVLDMISRGDSQQHDEYARRLFDWTMRAWEPDGEIDARSVYGLPAAPGEYFAAFESRGRRVTRADVSEEEWREWNMEFQRRLQRVIYFLYGGFIHGARRLVVDGIEPAEKKSESIQQELFEYVYHQIVRKDPEWVARDLLRAGFRAMEAQARTRTYPVGDIATLFLQTDHEVMLEPMIGRPIEEGDLLANASTVIYMGKIREGRKMLRALHIAKHRGSACSDEILPFRITKRGLELE